MKRQPLSNRQAEGCAAGTGHLCVLSHFICARSGKNSVREHFQIDVSPKRAWQDSNLQPLVPKANRFIFGVQLDVA
jgi:hypothetical protein